MTPVRAVLQGMPDSPGAGAGMIRASSIWYSAGQRSSGKPEHGLHQQLQSGPLDITPKIRVASSGSGGFQLEDQHFSKTCQHE